MNERILLSRAVHYTRDPRGYLHITLIPDWGRDAEAQLLPRPRSAHGERKAAGGDAGLFGAIKGGEVDGS